TMTKSEAINVIDAFEKSQLGIFLYSFENGEISIFYNDKSILKQTQYYSDKAIEKCKKIEFVADIRDCVNENNVFYIACTGQESSLINAKRRIENVPGVEIAFYLNIYNGDYCIEIFTDKASKKNAIIKLKEILACDEVVVFGDNLNDLSMFEIAQRKYAVSNALEAVKSEATEVIASCDEDGVARFIANELQKQMEDR
ncbi:MAG: HAD hydrolase family protein, partial [Oscillospiraceae bacterium]